MVVQAYRVVLLLILWCGVAFANPMIGVDNYTYFGTTAETITVQWGASANATGYELRAYHHEQQIYIWIGDTTELQHAYQLPKSGHYTFMVRAINETDVSAWTKSTDPSVANVDGQPRAWWVYGHVAPPGPIIIE